MNIQKLERLVKPNSTLQQMKKQMIKIFIYKKDFGNFERQNFVFLIFESMLFNRDIGICDCAISISKIALD